MNLPISRFNPQWIGQSISLPKHTRLVFDEILSKLDTGLITFLIGPRRLGKSTLLKQVLNHLLVEKQIKASQTFFFEFEPNQTRSHLDLVVSEYFQTKADKNLPFYLFLDEVQFIPDYELSLKYLVDNYHNIRILITGSLSLGYKRKMSESLAGRILPITIYPLCFEEYLTMSEAKELSIFSQAKDKSDLWAQASTELNPKFQEFLLGGTYPQSILWPKQIPLRDFLDTIVNQSLNQDAVKFFSIDRGDLIMALYQYLAANNGMEISLNKLSVQLQANIITIKKYLDVLELLGLIYILKNTTNPLKIPNSKAKIYVNSIFENSWANPNHNNLGASVESYVLERLLTQKHQVSFFRERNKEVDFIDHTAKEIVEVKYRTRFDSKLLNYLNYLAHDLKFSRKLITLNQTEFGNGDDSGFILKPACFV
jgi:predicted AAA+ superfamily ATPase